MTRLRAFAPVLVFAALAVGLAVRVAAPPNRMPATLIDRAMPPFALPPLYAGTAGFADSDVKGRVRLLNVFASWCPACRSEHAFLQTLRQQGSVPLFGMNWKDKPADSRRWLAAEGDPYERIGTDPEGRLGREIGVTGVPETFVIDATGRIRLRYEGPLTDDVWQTTFVPLLNELAGPR